MSVVAEQQRVAAELVKRHQVDAYKKLPGQSVFTGGFLASCYCYCYCYCCYSWFHGVWGHYGIGNSRSGGSTALCLGSFVCSFGGH